MLGWARAGFSLRTRWTSPRTTTRGTEAPCDQTASMSSAPAVISHLAPRLEARKDVMRVEDECRVHARVREMRWRHPPQSQNDVQDQRRGQDRNRFEHRRAAP
jgi:hypothetical protein